LRNTARCAARKKTLDFSKKVDNLFINFIMESVIFFTDSICIYFEKRKEKKMFYAGFARVDITPPFGLPLFYQRASGMLDPLELNAVAFSDGENRAVLITADLLYVMENVATEIRALVSKTCGIPAEAVFMQGLHPHTSVRVGRRPHLPNIGITDQEYLSVLYRKYCDVTKMALEDLKEATLETAEKETPVKLSFIRRYRMKNGAVATNPGRGNPNVEGPLGEADNTVRLIRLKRNEGGDIAIVNFSTHPDVIGGAKISADWPGFVRRMTEKDLEGVHCVLVNGAQGDTNHVDISENPMKRARYEHSAYMGRTITDTALSIWDQTRPRKTGKVWAQVEMMRVPTNTIGLDRVEEIQQLYRDIEAGIQKMPTDMGKRAEMWRISELPGETLFQKVPVSVLCLGEVAFVGFGGEPFTQYATAAREAGKEIWVITACLTNGGQGYLPTTEAFDEGGYEACNSRFSPQVAPILQKAAADLLDRYREISKEA